MPRHRALAASPARTASGCWNAVADLIAATLGRSSIIDQADVAATLTAITPAGRALIAGGHLDRDPITVVAEPLRLTIGTISGESSLAAIGDENLNPAPGAATASEWIVYLPIPAGVASLVEEVASGVPHVATGAPPAENGDATKAAMTIDLNRLDPQSRRTP